jgi:hypothetical protein
MNIPREIPAALEFSSKEIGLLMVYSTWKVDRVIKKAVALL